MKKFNVRVYGILIENNNLLVSDEYLHGKEITKFPGGGLEYGEGTLDCLLREFKEEMDLAVEIIGHFYTTDFFVNSAFSQKSQVISIYYHVRALESFKFPTTHRKFDFVEKKEGAQSLRWVSLSQLSENDFTFVIDKKVTILLTTEKKMLEI
jgi:8-oxo-dGTP diphosphatase